MPDGPEIILPEKPTPAPEVAGIGDKVPLSKSMPATTTEQEDMVTAGQRRVNILWEKTQRVIALSVVFATLMVNIFVTISVMAGMEIKVPQLVGVANLNSLANLIVGFYFARTNHSNIGGIGKKDQAAVR